MLWLRTPYLIDYCLLQQSRKWNWMISCLFQISSKLESSFLIMVAVLNTYLVHCYHIVVRYIDLTSSYFNDCDHLMNWCTIVVVINLHLWTIILFKRLTQLHHPLKYPHTPSQYIQFTFLNKVAAPKLNIPLFDHALLSDTPSLDTCGYAVTEKMLF